VAAAAAWAAGGCVATTEVALPAAAA
jgi:hypothetical protein